MSRIANRAWTNPSVRLLASHGDPLDEIRDLARDVVIDALDRGWVGPPFDPIELAKLRGLLVVPRDDVRDARLVPLPNGRLRIEYNPSRATPRVRYSLAHEIAHTLFPDCQERVRHRHAHGATVGDEWQLEALCNVAAAELLMPAATMPSLDESQLTIDEVSRLREKYAVSTEAVLIRITQMTPLDCAMFAASRIDKGPNAGRIRIDYMIGSRAWKHRLGRGTVLPETTALNSCQAIGFTAKSIEDWGFGVGHTRVEAVGIPAYPGTVHPRIVGIAVPTATTPRGAAITYLRGDATQPASDGNRVIAHVVNDATPNWGGSGFSVALRSRYETVQRDFRSWASTRKSDFRLGSVRVCKITDDLHAASLVSQRGYGESKGPRIRYRALRDGLDALADWASQHQATVHMPRIGAGQAGGRWEIVEQLIMDTLCRAGVHVYVYDLPGSRTNYRPDEQTPLNFAP